MIKTFLMFILVALIPLNVLAKPKVLLIESYHSDFFWDIDIVDGLNSVLKDSVVMLNFAMDTKRLPEKDHHKRAVMAWNYYKKTKPDIVILSDDYALKSLGPKFIQTKTPVVFLGINQNPRKYIPLHKNITGVLELLPFKRMIMSLKGIITKKDPKFLVLFDKSLSAQTILHNTFNSEKSFNIAGIHGDITSTSSFNEWMEAVQNAPKNGYSAVIMGLFYHLYVGNKHVDSSKVLQWTTKNSMVPVFSFWGVSVGKGKAVGGIVMTGKIQGEAAGMIVKRILNGEKVESINPIAPNQGTIIFSRHELNRWKINLPPQIKMRTSFID
ncbi:ABC transporter substrate-binding protein [Maridesulfovibrio zosterae]|uniref:ABC transporter substrate-binding protein n=1 Tax=Maridesulfovibrio zosterae TaxID=82171 RepID=UPI00042276EC|nr:ABC transporter substrate binding protein [Maridesulfovibrio zosterae]